MSVDKFGRTLRESKSVQGPPGIGFDLTDKGDYDIKSKRLCNLAEPKESNDAVNLLTLEYHLDSKSHELSQANVKLIGEIQNISNILDRNNNDIAKLKSDVDYSIKLSEDHRDELDKKNFSLDGKIDKLNADITNFKNELQAHMQRITELKSEQDAIQKFLKLM